MNTIQNLVLNKGFTKLAKEKKKSTKKHDWAKLHAKYKSDPGHDLLHPDDEVARSAAHHNIGKLMGIGGALGGGIGGAMIDPLRNSGLGGWSPVVSGLAGAGLGGLTTYGGSRLGAYLGDKIVSPEEKSRQVDQLRRIYLENLQEMERQGK